MNRGTAVSIGTFDGVHVGHRAILEELGRQARARGLPSVAYAFTTPPRWALTGRGDRYLLLPVEARLRLLEQFVDRVVPASFEEVRNLSPDAFVRSILGGQLRARVVVEGESFRFGHDRTGDIVTLRSIGEPSGTDVITVPPVRIAGSPVSSTRIRDALERGDLSTARACLGRPPSLAGDVSRGDGIGNSLGFPTANLVLDSHILLPPDGIYLVYALAEGDYLPGLLYLGTRPTLEDSAFRCEVFLLDFPARTLYGRPMELELLEKIREDRAFPSMSALREQIESDVRTARGLLKHYPEIEGRISS
jgi:riboflavin kinase / FMN adenylyltransferase